MLLWTNFQSRFIWCVMLGVFITLATWSLKDHNQTVPNEYILVNIVLDLLFSFYWEIEVFQIHWGSKNGFYWVQSSYILLEPGGLQTKWSQLHTVSVSFMCYPKTWVCRLNRHWKDFLIGRCITGVNIMMLSHLLAGFRPYRTSNLSWCLLEFTG